MDSVFALPRRLDAATTPDLSTKLGEITRQHSDIDLDAAQTVHIGALGAQLLLSVQRSIQDQNGAFRLLNLSDRARDQLAMMGLTELSLQEIDQ